MSRPTCRSQWTAQDHQDYQDELEENYKAPPSPPQPDWDEIERRHRNLTSAFEGSLVPEIL